MNKGRSADPASEEWPRNLTMLSTSSIQRSGEQIRWKDLAHNSGVSTNACWSMRSLGVIYRKAELHHQYRRTR